MGNPQLLRVDDIILTDFSNMPKVMVGFHQQTAGKFYYRLRLSPYKNNGFPVTYLYLGDYETVPKYSYTNYFSIASVKNSSLVNTSFEALFRRFPEDQYLQTIAQLQSCARSDFPSGQYETGTETRNLTIRLSGNNFSPTWTCPTWIDTSYSSNAGIQTLTGSDQKGVQGVSEIRFDFPTAEGKYGTTIEKYSITVTNGISETYTPSRLASLNRRVYMLLSHYPKLKGNVTVIFSVTDSRGLTTSFTRTLSIVPYKEICLLSNNTHRQGGTGSTVLLDFAGQWFGSPLALTCTGVKAYVEGSSTVYASLDPAVTVSGTSFSYNGAWSGVTFDSDKAYTIIATFTDTVRTVTLTLPIPVGTPVMSIRDKKVGIQNGNPNYTLDVGGVVAQNAYPVLGFRGFIGDSESADLNDYTETGYYIYRSGDSSEQLHFPSGVGDTHLILMVINAKGFSNYNNGIQKLWRPNTGEEYTRTFYGSLFTSWKEVTMT